MGRAADSIAREAWDSNQLFVSAFTYWEVSMLVRKKRVHIRLPASSWQRDLEEAGIRAVPLDGPTAAMSEELSDMHGDPADRLILATALTTSATLMTADHRLLAWPGELARIDAAR